MRELVLVGFVGVGFGLGSYYMLGSLGGFGAVNLIGGIAALTAGLVQSVRGIGAVRQVASRGPLVESVLIVVALCWGVVLIERFAEISAVRFDWTFERQFELSPATRGLLERLPDRLQATLYHDSLDPRTRRTRVLLDGLAQHGPVDVRQIALDTVPEDEDRYGIGTSNTVILRIGPEDGARWQKVERPTEGGLFEGLARLLTDTAGIVYLTVGTGEGDVERSDDLGFSGLGVALQTEGYVVRTLSTPFVRDIPVDADVLLTIAPERRLREPALDAIQRYLERGGSLVAFLEPGRNSGVEQILSNWGITSADALIVDPTSGPVDGDAFGLSPIAFNYSEHPVTSGLDRNRMTFFRRTRSFELRKPESNDRMDTVVYASGESWLRSDPGSVGRNTRLSRPADVDGNYHAIAVTGQYQRDGVETRIVAFGDSHFASNRYLRALFNLDLVMNAVHWSVRREPAITLRPKGYSVIQFPVPIQSSLTAFYGVGLLVPEALLVIGGLVTLRRRQA